jgi:sec-independent protein translocase protein TatA
MVPEIGISGLILILIVALLVFGPKRLPEMGRSLGKGMREFKDSIAGKDDDETPELTQSTTPAETPAPPPQPREHDTVP